MIIRSLNCGVLKRQIATKQTFSCITKTEISSIAVITKHDMTLFILDSREERDFDLSLVLILFMAVSTVMLGSLWSGYAKQSLRLR
jgi:hypothetical protein